MLRSGYYIPRVLENDISDYLKSPEIIAIIGPRQSGKTTLLHQLAHSLASEKISFVDFEDRDDLRLFVNDIKSFAQLHVQGQDFLFIDEFQYATDGGKNLKYLYDHFPVKILITGSSSTELSIQSIQYLVGRIFVFHLFPFSFDEYLGHKESKLVPLVRKGEEIGPDIADRINLHYADFQIYGGYPRIALCATVEERELVIKNIFNTYLLREINQILNYQDEFKLTRLINALALQVGSSINYNELSSVTGFNYKELIEAIDILEKTFVLQRSTPYFKNKRLELVKSPKFFFVDNGFRNMAIRNFLPADRRTDLGSLNENFVATELIKKGFSLHYWRTKSKAEVDFILQDQGEVIPLEVKTTLKKPSISRSYRSFLEKYEPRRGFITSHRLLDKARINNTEISFVPHWLLDL